MIDESGLKPGAGGYTYRYFKRAPGSRQHVYGGRCKAEHIQIPSLKTELFMEKYDTYSVETVPVRELIFIKIPKQEGSTGQYKLSF